MSTAAIAIEHIPPAAARDPKWFPEAIGILDYEDGEMSLRRFGMEPAKPGSISNVGDLVLLAAENELGQIWVTPRCAIDALQLPAALDLTTGIASHPFGAFDLLDAAIDPGAGVLARWYVARWTDGTGRICVALPHLDNDAPWREAKDAAALMKAIRLFREHVGTEWYWSIGSTASGLASRSYPGLRRAWNGREPADQCHAVHSGKLEIAQPGRYRSPVVTQWIRPFDANDWGTVTYGYDCNAAYLGAIGSAVLPYGEPVHWPDRAAVLEELISSERIRRLANGTLPGYFRLSEAPKLDPEMLLPGFRFTNPEAMWVTGPILEFLFKQGISASIEEAWVWPETVRPFEEFAAKLSKARGALLALEAKVTPDLDGPVSIALAAVKCVYSTFYSWLARRERMSDKGLWMPHWFHPISDLALMNQWRRIIKIAKVSKRWPIAARNDELLYASGAGTHRDAAPDGMLLPESRSVGTFKPDGWADTNALFDLEALKQLRDPQRPVWTAAKFWRTWERTSEEGERQ